MRATLVIVLLLLVPVSTAGAATLFVPSADYPTIQSAIDAAGEDDVIVVRDGVHRGPGNARLRLGTGNLTLRSEHGPAACTIDCEGQSRGIIVADGVVGETTIQGFTIRNGAEPQEDGGGIYCGVDSVVRVLDCVISDCRVGESNRGGGIACATLSVVSIENTEISRCRAGAYGGGIFCEGASNVDITSCRLRDNEAFEADGFGGHGGGVAVVSANVVMLDTELMNNWAIGDGGALTCDENSDALFSRCRFVRNVASGRGGGVCFWEAALATLQDSIVAGNLARGMEGGGGVYVRNSAPLIDHCTITGNRSMGAEIGGGIYAEGDAGPLVTHCIVWDNVGGGIHIQAATDSVSYSDVQGGFDGEGNIKADPRFVGFTRDTIYVDAANAGDSQADGSADHPYASLGPAIGLEADAAMDYRLADDSPCVGTGLGGSDMGALRGTGGTAGAIGFTVRVAAGTYSLAGCSFHRHASLVGAGAELTILEGPGFDQRQTAAIENLRTDAMVQGVTVRGSAGRAIRVDTGQRPTIDHCTIERNAGGIECIACSPTLAHCLIRENAGFYGGGIACSNGSSPLVTACVIKLNSASQGGGISCNDHSSPTLRSCEIVENSADDHAGGLYCQWQSNAVLVDCLLARNTAGATGGGVMTRNSNVTLSQCRVEENAAPSGGGLSLGEDSWGLRCRPELVNCIIAGNSAGRGNGGGVLCEGLTGLAMSNCLVVGNRAEVSGGAIAAMQARSVSLSNCTAAGNAAKARGGGLFGDCSQMSVANTILWGNSAQRGPAVALARTCTQPPAGTSLAVVYSLVGGGEGGIDADSGTSQAWGETCLDLAPMLVSPAGADGRPETWADNDYRLSPGSPAIDAGNNDLVSIDSTDLDGDGRRSEIIPFDLAGRPRLLDDPDTVDAPGEGPPTTDMGAYEHFVRAAADFDDDADVDSDDLEAFRACVSGPTVGPVAEACLGKDLDGDHDVDQSDFGLFQRCLSGTGQSPRQGCAE